MTYARLLLAAMTLTSLAAQDVDVAKFLRDLRTQSDKAAPSATSDREFLAVLTKRLETSSAASQRAQIYSTIAYLQQQLGDPAAAIASLRTAKELQSENLRIALQLAEALAADHQDREATELYRQSLGVDPHDTAPLMRHASELMAANADLDVALACAQLAVKLEPANPRLLDTLGLINLKKSLPDAAIRIYNQLVEQVPEVSTYHYHLGMAFLQKGFVEYARPELATALRLNPAPEERELIEKLLASAPQN